MTAYVQNLNCDKWLLGDVPEFDGGLLSHVFLNCGCALADDTPGFSCGDSFMHTAENVSVAEFEAYKDKLVSDGFAPVWERKAGLNIFRELEKCGKYLYTEYIGNDRTAKIILEGEGEPLCGFGTAGGEDICGNTALVQYSLHYDTMIHGVTADCGMLYALRLRDNSVILVDGGEIEQSTDIAVADLMNLLHGLTKTSKNEKIRIAMWFCTHAHDDHMDFFVKLINRYSNELELERVSFNFPSSCNIQLGEPVFRLRKAINSAYPGVRFLKIHTGQEFSLNSAKITVLSTHEDMFTGDVEKRYNGMNKTSSIIKIGFENESLLLLADAEEVNGDFLIRNYSQQELVSTFIQAAHHGINRDENIYNYVKSPYILLPQARRDRDAAPDGVFGIYLRDRKYEDIFVAGENTYTFICDGKSIKTEVRAHVGTAYDGSGF